MAAGPPGEVLRSAGLSDAVAQELARRLGSDPAWLRRFPRGGALLATERAGLRAAATHSDDELARVLFEHRLDVTYDGGGGRDGVLVLWDRLDSLPAGHVADNPELERFVEGSGWYSGDRRAIGLRPGHDAIVHEVGHAVDESMGRHTELVYELAGWEVYGASQFRDWLDDMGAWEGAAEEPAEADKQAIAELFSQVAGIEEACGPARLVDLNHPINSTRYRGAAIVELARNERRVLTTDNPWVRNGRAWSISDRGARSPMSCLERALEDRPSWYAMTGPSEWFAEAYRVYYEGYDGTPATEGRKGGDLAEWIRTWIDRNIDSMR